MKSGVFLTRALPQPVMDRLKTLFDLEYNSINRPLSRKQVIQGMRGRPAIITMLSDTMDEGVIASNPKLRVISNYAVGYNNIDLTAASSRGIVVTNTPGVLTESTADLAWSIILGLARRVVEGDRLVRTGRWTGWNPTQLLGTELSGKVLGIIGMGRIGMAVARRAHGFGMRVAYHSRGRLTAGDETRFQANRLSLSRLLSLADIVSLHVPLTDKTRHLIDRHALTRMKRTAYLINTARGPVVDEKALITALRRGEIAGAGLDVFEEEPSVPASLRSMPNVVLLPHLGSGTVETRIRMGSMVIENIRAVLEGKPAPNAVRG